MKLTCSSASDAGLARPDNADRFLVNQDLGLCIVADGVGIDEGGEVAASIAIEAARQCIEQALPLLLEYPTSVALRDVMMEATQSAAARVHFLAEICPRLRCMGTTLTMLLVVGDRVATAHVGDSRIYRIRNGCAELLTVDHTLENELRKECQALGVNPVNAKYRHRLTQSIGEFGRVDVDARVLPARSGDRFLLCTDGFSNYAPQESTVADLMQGQGVGQTAARLVDFALAAGGGDNVTVVVLDCDESDSNTEPHLPPPLEKRGAAPKNIAPQTDGTLQAFRFRFGGGR